MKPKTVILVVVALGCGLAASVMTSKLITSKTQAPPAEEKVSLLVTKTKVPKHTVLKEPEKYFELKTFLKANAPKNAFTELSQLKDKKVNKDLKAEMHVSADDLFEKGNSVLDVPAGFRAISLKVTAAQIVSGFVYPGDKVDVIMTRTGAEASSQTILRNVLVVSVGNVLVRPEGESAALPANTVNVALTPDDAQLARLAEKLGELSLTLVPRESDPTPTAARITTPDDLRRAVLGLPHGAVAQKPDEEKIPGVGLKLPELEQMAQKQKEEKEPEEPAVLKPEWTITIYPGYDPPVQAHYFKHQDGAVSRDDADAANPPAKDVKKPAAKKPAAKKPTAKKPAAKPAPKQASGL